MAIIDADTHVIESEHVWDFFDSNLSHLRPYLVPTRDVHTGVERNRWVIDGKLVPKHDGPGGQFLATPPLGEALVAGDGEIPWSWRSLSDPAGRVLDAKERGVDLQIIYPTLFIAYLTDDVELEVALSRAYNRYMSQAWSDSQRGFQWIMVLPLRSIEASLDEMRYCIKNGSVGVLFRGMEGDRSLADPYFDPIYQAASDLDLPICIHTGPGSPTLTGMMNTRYTKTFGHNRLPPLIAFHDLVACRVPERFPSLRFGFLEATASWVPFLLHFHRRVARKSGMSPDFYGPELFQDYRIYIACESDEDIPYLAKSIGWDHLLAGTDYGHTDQSAELDLVGKLCSRPDLSKEQIGLILEENPSRFYRL